MNKGFLAGAIRRHESIKALKECAQEPLPSFIQDVGTNVPPHAMQQETVPTTNLTKFPCLQQAVQTLEKKKQDHLQLPSQRGGGIMRLSSFFIILFLLIMAALFFFGGYLYSYMHLPGPSTGTNIATAQYPATTPTPNWRKQQETIPGTGILEAAPAGPSYFERRETLRKDQAIAEDAFTQGGSRSKIVARQQAKEVIRNSTDKMTDAVKSFAGERVARIFNPFAMSVAGGTFNTLTDDKKPQGSSSTKGEPAPAKTIQKGAEAPPHDGHKTSQSAPSLAAGAQSSQAQPVVPLYAIEVGTFEDDGTAAWALMKSLADRGYPDTYVAREFENNHLFFKVRIGHFQSYLDASRAREVLDMPSRVVVVEPNENRLLE